MTVPEPVDWHYWVETCSLTLLIKIIVKFSINH